MKTKANFLIILFVIFTISLFFYVDTGREEEDIKSVLINDDVVYVKVAKTTDELARGLGGVEKLNSNEGMLFIFKKEGEHLIWMKNMLIPIDILWLNKNGVIIHIENNISPDTYFKGETFGKGYLSKYVVELSSGYVKENDVEIGDIVLFQK